VLRDEAAVAPQLCGQELVTVREGDDKPCNPQPLLLSDPFDLPPVDQPDAAVLEEHYVTRVWVTVEETIVKELVAVRVQRARGRAQVVS
jgi:hypothetical protein